MILLCLDNIAQPFAPMRIGEPGVILFAPGTVLLEDTREMFHVLVNSSVRGKKTKLRYCGTYTRVRAPYMDSEVEIDEWHALSDQCRLKLLKQLLRTTVSNIHARCSLRMRKRLASGPDPSPAEIREWTRKYRQGYEKVEPKAFRNSFDSGLEKFGFEVIKCVGYDVELVGLVQRLGQTNLNCRGHAHYRPL